MRRQSLLELSEALLIKSGKGRCAGKEWGKDVFAEIGVSTSLDRFDSNYLWDGT
nr:hypothetical protein [Vibrio lentus]